jgi:bifunctional DNase/RNase
MQMRAETVLLSILLALAASAAVGARWARSEPDASGGVRVDVDRVLHDPRGGYVVLLREVDGERVLPIWIGPAEAYAIASRLAGDAPPRPQTHDLMRNLLVLTGARLERVTVREIREDTYFGVLQVRMGDEVRNLDARPSDAIALAMRAGAPIYVAEGVFASLDPLGEEGVLSARGVTLRDLLPHEALESGLAPGQGALVLTVEREADGWVRPGDVLLAAGGEVLEGAGDLKERLDALGEGKRLLLELIREGKVIRLFHPGPPGREPGEDV